MKANEELEFSYRSECRFLFFSSSLHSPAETSVTRKAQGTRVKPTEKITELAAGDGDCLSPRGKGQKPVQQKRVADQIEI